MKKIFICLSLFALILLQSCGNIKDEYQYDDGPAKVDWNAAADSCTFVLVDQFLNKDKGVFWGSHNNMKNNSSYLYWQEAHAMDVLVYSYERIKSSNPSLAAQYVSYFKLWFANHANNWYNWQGSGDTTGFYNEYTDDMSWISLTMLHMTEATGDETYYNMAKKIFDDYISKRVVSDDAGFGLGWKLGDMVRNACTNAPACLVACKLYNKTKDTSYLEFAKKLYNYITDNLMNSDGSIEDTPLTYTQGTFAEAARRLFAITKDNMYMNRAEKAILYTITSSRCLTNNILRNEGNDENNSIFKAVFVPYAVNLALDENASSLIRDKIKTFLIQNARTMWLNNVDRSAYPSMYISYYWGETYTTSTAIEYSGSLGAQASGAELLEGVARLVK
jgi:predicted alpha-1,6-mannanase (GH76 family)